MDYSAYADTLAQLQAVENNGRGISCVRSIVIYLRRGEWENAIAIRRLEGDKTRCYPKVEAALTKILGCRLHAAIHCSSWLCNEIRR